MDVAVAVGGIRNTRVRTISLVLALMLAATTLLIVQQGSAGAAQRGSAVTAAIAGVDAPTAQINFGAIFCAILIAVRNAFDDSPFFGFIAAILNALLNAFGCSPSG